jgi:hypothetical protein
VADNRGVTEGPTGQGDTGAHAGKERGMSFPTPDAIHQIASDRRHDALRDAAVHRAAAASHRRHVHRAWRDGVRWAVATLRHPSTVRPRRRAA